MSEVRNGDQKGHTHYFRTLRCIDKCYILFHICTSYSKKLKGRTELYVILFLKLNDHPTRCFNFGLRRVHPNGCKFELNFKKSNLKQNPSKNSNKYDQGYMFAFEFPVVT